MSLRKTMLLLMVFLCTYAGATAQQTTIEKPKLFASYPASFAITEACLQNIFNYSANQETVIDFGSNLLFPCKIVRNEVKYSNLQTVILRSSAFDNALFQVSKIINRDQSITYTGRIINQKAADGFEIKKNNDGSYRLQKFETDKILEGCFL
jgi:hypothetical protein